MKSRGMIAFLTIGSVVALLPGLSGGVKDPEAMINHAASVIMAPDASASAVKAALGETLEATLLILPKTDYAEEFRSKIEVARKLFEETSFFNEKARQYIGLAYRLVAGGAVWQVPEELKSAYRQKDVMEQAREICKKLVETALAERKAGRNEASVRSLLELVLLVITPIQA